MKYTNQEKLIELECKCRLYEAWLRALDENTNFDIWFKNNDSQYLYVNKKFEKAMGLSRQQLLGKTPQQIFSDTERQERVYALDKRIMDKGYIHRIVPCDGSGILQMHEEHRFPVHDDDGSVIGLGCFAIEVSGQSFAEEALTQAQTIAKLGDWRWSIKEKCLISCSDQFAQLLGVSVQEVFSLMHRRLDRVVYPGDRHIVEPIVNRQHPDEHTPYHIEYRIVQPNGAIRYVVEIAQPLLGNEGVAVEYVGILQDITEQKRIENELREAKEQLEVRVAERTRNLEYIASHDSLTGLLNRSSYLHYFNHRVEQRGGAVDVAIAILDLDSFKLVNDSHGHLAGDTVLKTVASRLRGSVKENDIVVRLGGDEFALIFFDLNNAETNIKKICERLKDIICSPIAVGHISVRVGCSFGISFLKDEPCNKEVLEQAMANADIALYKAKLTQGAFYSVFEQEMGAEVAYRHRLENDFRAALAGGQLSVAFQPQIYMANDALCGIEALARWHHPELGNITPDIFIPIAEECGLIDQLSEFVLQQSCQCIESIRSETSHKNIKVAVNFSVAQFYNENLLGKIHDILAFYALPPEALEVEVTESLFIQNPEYTKSILDQMRNHGLKVSLDDFGTGYSSLSYLKEFEVDTIKLDRTFIKAMTVQDSHLKIVDGIIKLAKSLDLMVVAEGVENQEQHAILTGLGCDIAQGFLHGKPMSEQQLLHFVQDKSISKTTPLQKRECRPPS